MSKKSLSQPNQEFESFVKQFVQLVDGKNYEDAISLIRSVDKSFLKMPLGSVHQNNSFLYACQKGDKDLVEAIFVLDPTLIETRNAHQSTPLHEAAINLDHPDIAEFLLAKQPELIGSQNERHNTPLHFAIRKQNTEIAKFFVTKMTPEQIAIPTKVDGFHALHVAVHAKNVPLIETLIVANEKSVFSPDAEGRIPLHHAVRATSSDGNGATAALLKHKAVEQIKTQAGGENNYTPMHSAATCNNIEAIELMHKMCPEAVNMIGYDGRSPLHAAAASRQDCTAAGIMLCGITDKQVANAWDNTHKTPTLHAFEKGRDNLGKFLAEHSNSPDAFSQLQESMLQLSESKLSNQAIPSSLKSFNYHSSVLQSMSIRLTIEGNPEEGHKFYKAAKRLAESELQSQELTGPRFSDCSGQYPPFLVKESLEAVLDKSYIIEFVNSAWSRDLVSRIESFIDQIEQNKKVLLLLTDEKMTICDRAIKLEKKGDDECKFIYINPRGTTYAVDTTAKAIFQHASAKTESLITLADLKTSHASEGANIGIYIIEDIIRLAQLDASASRPALVKALPTSHNFDPEKAEKQMEWGRDTSPFYSTEKMKLLAPLVFTDLETKLFPPLLLLKQEVIETFKEATQYVMSNGKPATLVVYDATQKHWSGLALKKNAETGNVTLFFSDPQNQLAKFIGGISKVMIQHSQGFNIVKATENYEKIWDSGPATLGNLCKFICTDLSLLSSSRIGAMLKFSIDDTRIEHIGLLQKAGINVPPFERVNFSDRPTSYTQVFNSQFEQETVSLEEGDITPQKILGDNADTVFSSF